MRPNNRRRPVVLGKTQQRRHRPDYALVLISVILLMVGMVVIYSISPALVAQQNVGANYYVTKQVIAIVLGVLAFITTSLIPVGLWRNIQKPLIISSLVAAGAVRFFGERVYGAYRWIQIGGVSFQAVELGKFALLIWLAAFLVERYKRGELSSFDKTLKPLLLVIGAIGLIVTVIESDLGSTGVIVAMIAAMGYVVGLPLRRIAIFGGIIAIGLILAVSTSSYRRDRLLTYVHPERDCLDTGYQVCQSLISVGSGGLTGKGLARGVQAYGYQPESANDSIFAIFAEKFGFVGVSALIGCFMFLFIRIKNIMERAPDLFSRLVVAGALAWLSTQTIINIGAMIGLLPLKGITLPFISYGGTSIMFVMAVVGMVFNISRYTTYSENDAEMSEGSSYDNPSSGGRNRRTYYAPVGRRT